TALEGYSLVALWIKGGPGANLGKASPLLAPVMPAAGGEGLRGRGPTQIAGRVFRLMARSAPTLSRRFLPPVRTSAEPTFRGLRTPRSTHLVRKAKDIPGTGLPTAFRRGDRNVPGSSRRLPGEE